jgi:NADH-quinone oxidoreductase subunit B
MIVSGRVSNKMAPVIKRIYDQMLAPKWVIAMGICASAGGPFNNYAIIQGVDKIIPVDVYVPGCPPRPESLLYAMDMLRAKQGRESIVSGRQVEEPLAIDEIMPLGI